MKMWIASHINSENANYMLTKRKLLLTWKLLSIINYSNEINNAILSTRWKLQQWILVLGSKMHEIEMNLHVWATNWIQTTNNNNDVWNKPNITYEIQLNRDLVSYLTI